jgi:hypothetical protein
MVHQAIYTTWEILHGLVILLLVYGMLFCPQIYVIYASVVASIVLIVLAQLTDDTLINHLQSMHEMHPKEEKSRFQIIAQHVGTTVRIEPSAVYLFLLIMTYLTVMVGFFRLFQKLSLLQGFL